MNTKEKPKSWAVWNDGSQEFDDVVLKYINENFARNWEGDCDLLFYGVDTEQNPMVSEYSIHFENILSLNEFREIFLNEKISETPEEAAKKFYPPLTTDLICAPKLVRDAFIAGAKWQQNQTVLPDIDAVVDLLKSVSDETGVPMDKLNARIIDENIHVWKLVLADNSSVELEILKTFNINK